MYQTIYCKKLIMWETTVGRVSRVGGLRMCENFVSFLLTFSIFCCAGWGYIVAFIKVLTLHQMYHTWNHPLHHSPLFPSPLLPGTVSTGIIFHLHTCVHSICTIFTLPLPFPTTFSLPLIPTPQAGPVPPYKVY
jgi:hypothetical protein